jgi:pimeloyl-ACP methyl ester carboxylesterase
MVLRGRDSDLLLDETAREMTKRGPGATLVEFEECGHNPALLERHQIDPILDWLRANGNDGR